MKNRIIALVGMILLLFSSSIHAQITFERWYGGIYDDEAYSFAQTSDVGYIIAGSTDSYGAGFTDVYVIKTDINGDTLWTRTYGGSDWDYALSGAQTSDEGYIMAGWTWSYGAGNCDVYLIKTDANGDTLWTRTYGGIHWDGAFSVAQTSDGGYIIAGYTESFSAGFDVYFIKTDASGIVGIRAQKNMRYGSIGNHLTCHPNPFVTSTSITIEGLSDNQNIEESNLIIYDASGRLVKSIKLETNTYKLGTDLKAGIYFLKLNGKPVGKVVKVR